MSRGKYARRSAARTPEGLAARKAAAEAEIRSLGFDLVYVEWCEDGETPGMLGAQGGVTMRHKDGTPNKVKVRTHAVDERTLVQVLEHEAHHCRDRWWDCGNRNYWGFDTRPMKGTPEYEEWDRKRREKAS